MNHWTRTFSRFLFQLRHPTTFGHSWAFIARSLVSVISTVNRANFIYYHLVPSSLLFFSDHIICMLLLVFLFYFIKVRTSCVNNMCAIRLKFRICVLLGILAIVTCVWERAYNELQLRVVFLSLSRQFVELLFEKKKTEPKETIWFTYSTFNYMLWFSTNIFLFFLHSEFIFIPWN